MVYFNYELRALLKSKYVGPGIRHRFEFGQGQRSVPDSDVVNAADETICPIVSEPDIQRRRRGWAAIS